MERDLIWFHRLSSNSRRFLPALWPCMIERNSSMKRMGPVTVRRSKSVEAHKDPTRVNLTFRQFPLGLI